MGLLVNMCTYEAGTKVAVCIKQEKVDEDDICNSKIEENITKGKTKVSESANNAKKQINESNRQSKDEINSPSKSNVEVRQQQPLAVNQQDHPQNNFAQTNKFSIFNLLNTKHKKSPSAASCTVSSSSAAGEVGSSLATRAAPDLAAACTSRLTPPVGESLRLKRSSSLQLFAEDADGEEGWLRQNNIVVSVLRYFHRKMPPRYLRPGQGATVAYRVRSGYHRQYLRLGPRCFLRHKMQSLT